MRARLDAPLHKSENLLHTATCGIVYMEGHGMLSMIGGTLSVVFFIYFIVDAGDA